MKRLGIARAVHVLRWPMLALLAAGSMMIPVISQAQAPPVEAVLFLASPRPPGAVYDVDTPIAATLRIEAVEPFLTVRRWPRQEMRRFLVLKTPSGRTLIPKGHEFHHRHEDADADASTCTRADGVRLSNRLVAPAVALSPNAVPPFFLEFAIADLRAIFDIAESGIHTARAQIPLQVYDDLVSNCDNLDGDLVDLNLPRPGGPFKVLSNSIQFVNSTVSFVGFDAPLDCLAPPCGPFNRGGFVAVRFQLFDAGGEPIDSASVGIVASEVDPEMAPISLGTFSFDTAKGEYVFSLDTAQLADGEWRIAAQLPDGLTRSVTLLLETSFTFEGFSSPLIGDAECPTLDCNAFSLGQTVPLKFQLFDVDTGEPLEDQSIEIAVTGLDPPMLTSNEGTMRFQKSQDSYIFNLRTKGLAPGLWRLDAVFPDGSTQSVHFILS